MLIGGSLFGLSVPITSLVKDSTDRAIKSSNIIQNLGASLFWISVSILLCMFYNEDNKLPTPAPIVIIIIILLIGIATTTLASIIYKDCESAKWFSLVLILLGVFQIAISLLYFVVMIIKKKKDEGAELGTATPGKPVAAVKLTTPAVAVAGGATKLEVECTKLKKQAQEVCDQAQAPAKAVAQAKAVAKAGVPALAPATATAPVLAPALVPATATVSRAPVPVHVPASVLATAPVTGTTPVTAPVYSAFSYSPLPVLMRGKLRGG